MTRDNDFEAFAASLASLSFFDAHRRVQEEGARLRRAFQGSGRNHRGAPAARERYGVFDERLGGLGFFIVNGGLPAGWRVEEDYPIYRRLAEAWVARGDLKPTILDLFRKTD